MKILKLQLTNFRCFASLEFELDERLTVFIGENAAGKTALVEAINIGLGPIMERLRRLHASRLEEEDIRRGLDGAPAPHAEVALQTANPDLQWDLDATRDRSPETRQQSRELRQRLGRTRRRLKQLNRFLDPLLDQHRRKEPFELPVFAFYEADRAAKDAAGPKPGLDPYYERFAAYVKAHRAGISFNEAVGWFGRTQHQALATPGAAAEQALRIVKEALTRLLPKIERLEFQPAANRLAAHFRSPTGAAVELPVSRLSHGYQGMLALVMDFARRLAIANPENPRPLDAEAVCLIDEVDLHLHPEWQQRVISDLLTVFSKTQFICTTHSPQVLTTIPPRHIRRIDFEPGEPGRHLLREPTSSLGAESSRVLEDVMHVPPRPPRDAGSILHPGQPAVQETLHQYLDLVRSGEGGAPPAMSLRESLDALTNREEPALERADAEMRRQKLFGP